MQKAHNFMLRPVILPICLPYAQATGSTEKEIQYLFEFISQSDCIFMRNNSEYPAKKARDHMQTQYNYAKRRLENLDQFDEHIFRKGSISDVVSDRLPKTIIL